MSEEIKKCPLCGQFPKVEYFTRSGVATEGRWYISCPYCDIRATTIFQWNFRPLEDEKDKEIERLKGNWDYFKEYLVALRNSRLHDECLAGSVLNRYAISFLNGLIEKMNATDNDVGSITVKMEKGEK